MSLLNHIYLGFFFFCYWITFSSNIFQRFIGGKTEPLLVWKYFLSFHKNIIWLNIFFQVQNIFQQNFEDNVSLFYWNQYYQEIWCFFLLEKSGFKFWLLVCLSSLEAFRIFLFILRLLKFHDGVSSTESFYSYSVWLLVNLSGWRLPLFFKSESLLAVFYFCNSFFF